jgi:hypothetical protein
MRPPEIPHVKYVTNKKSGKLYAYFNTGQKKDGKPIYAPLPHPATVGFWDSLAALNAGRTKRENRAYTVEQMIADYQGSPDWERLAPGSQKFYEAAFRRIREAFGDWPVNDVEAEYVEKEMDSLSGDGARNAFFSVLGILYSWGRRRYWRPPLLVIPPASGLPFTYSTSPASGLVMCALFAGPTWAMEHFAFANRSAASGLRCPSSATWPMSLPERPSAELPSSPTGAASE